MNLRTRPLGIEEAQRFSLINNLKLRIQELEAIVRRQDQIICNYKHSTKTTKINEQ